MEINLNLVLFEELREEPDANEAVARIVIVRESRDSQLALEDGSATFYPLD
jgi:hypothetical protein